MTNHASGQARLQAGGSPANNPLVRVMIVAPAPFGEDRIGGIVNFIRGFVHNMPDDFAAEIVGVAVGGETPGNSWRRITFAGRQVRFLPVARMSSARREGRIPTKAAIVAGMIRARRQLNTSGRIVQLHSPAMDLGLIGRDVPIVRVVHNAPEELAASNGESDWRRLGSTLHLVERLSFRRADRVFFVDRSTYQRYVESEVHAGQGMRYLPNGVDTDVFHPLNEEDRGEQRRRLAAELNLPAEARWLLFAGRLDHQKDPALLMQTFAATLRTRPDDTVLLVAGEGNLRAETERLSRELGVDRRLHFLGLWPHQRMSELMPAADVFVMSSAFEAAPFTVLEALASGLPVVSTAVGEVPRLVQQGSTGSIATERTPEALAQGIAWALAQPHEEVARKCAASMEPYRIRNVLAPFYAEHRLLAKSRD